MVAERIAAAGVEQNLGRGILLILCTSFDLLQLILFNQKRGPSVQTLRQFTAVERVRSHVNAFGDCGNPCGGSGIDPSCPQTTDIQLYARKLQFLRDIWPAEHVAQLAPRAALQVQGVAFQKVARLDTTKLRISDGVVKYLVESHGW